jgi:hypothetical protein
MTRCECDCCHEEFALEFLNPIVFKNGDDALLCDECLKTTGYPKWKHHTEQTFFDQTGTDAISISYIDRQNKLRNVIRRLNNGRK